MQMIDIVAESDEDLELAMNNLKKPQWKSNVNDEKTKI